LLDPDRIGAGAYNVRDERRWALIGRTEDDRITFVVFTRRRNRPRVVTARNATDAEKRRYRRRGK